VVVFSLKATLDMFPMSSRFCKECLWKALRPEVSTCTASGGADESFLPKWAEWPTVPRGTSSHQQHNSNSRGAESFQTRRPHSSPHTEISDPPAYAPLFPITVKWKCRRSEKPMRRYSPIACVLLDRTCKIGISSRLRICPINSTISAVA
jgi:hypothetical protein